MTTNYRFSFSLHTLLNIMFNVKLKNIKLKNIKLKNVKFNIQYLKM
jgi:hypothetical protein